MSYGCWSCGEQLAQPGYCEGCSFHLDRERLWQDAGFNPDGTTPFVPPIEPLAEPEDPA